MHDRAQLLDMGRKLLSQGVSPTTIVITTELTPRDVAAIVAEADRIAQLDRARYGEARSNPARRVEVVGSSPSAVRNLPEKRSASTGKCRAVIKADGTECDGVEYDSSGRCYICLQIGR